MLRLILVFTLAATGLAHAQNYPTKTVPSRWVSVSGSR